MSKAVWQHPADGTSVIHGSRSSQVETYEQNVGSTQGARYVKRHWKAEILDHPGGPVGGTSSHWQRSVLPPALWRIEAEHGRVAMAASQATEIALALSR